MPTIVPKSSEDARRLITALLRLVPDREERRRRIRPVTAGPRIAYEVDDELAGMLSFTDASDVGVEPPEPPEGPVTPDDDDNAASDELSGQTDDPPADTEPAVVPEVPDRNDKTVAWAEYMGAAFPDYDPTGKSRGELIAEYDRRTSGSA